jgi:hypothetical protein
MKQLRCKGMQEKLYNKDWYISNFKEFENSLNGESEPCS